jgi:phosphatidate phosphatase APP1
LNQSQKTPVLWQLSVLELDGKNLVNGVVVRSLPFALGKQASYLRNFLRSLSSYVLKPYSEREISVEVNGEKRVLKTDAKGAFRLIFDQTLLKENIIIRTSSGEPISIKQSYPVFFRKTKGPIDVISDVDDTIITSYTKSLIKRIGSILFTPPQKRKPIGFTQNLFKIFDNNQSRVLYISKSESNLFAMLSAIIQHHKLPHGNLILTPYLNFKELLNSKKARDYKLNHIKFILENTTHKKYVLIGDDTQKDMEVYTKIVDRFPDRIVKVYIRQTKSQVKPYQSLMLHDLKATGIDFTYFDDNTSLNAKKEYERLLNKIS